MTTFSFSLNAKFDYFFSDLDGTVRDISGRALGNTVSGNIIVSYDDVLSNDGLPFSFFGQSYDIVLAPNSDPSIVNDPVARTITFTSEISKANYGVFQNGVQLGASTLFAAKSDRTVANQTQSNTDPLDGIAWIRPGNDGFDRGFGTGFLIGERTVATAAHVVEDSLGLAFDDFVAFGANQTPQFVFPNIGYNFSNLVSFSMSAGGDFRTSDRVSDDLALISGLPKETGTVFGLEVYIDPNLNAHPLVTNATTVLTAGFPSNRQEDLFSLDSTFTPQMVVSAGQIASVVPESQQSGSSQSATYYYVSNSTLDTSSGQSGSPAYVIGTDPLDGSPTYRAVGIVAQTDILLANTDTPAFTSTNIAPISEGFFKQTMALLESSGDMQPDGVWNRIVGSDANDFVFGGAFHDERIGGAGLDVFTGRPQDFDGDVLSDIEVGEFLQFEFAPGTRGTVVFDAVTVAADADPTTLDTVTIDIDGDGTAEARFSAYLPESATFSIDDLNNPIKTDVNGNEYISFRLNDNQLGYGFSPNGLQFLSVEDFVTAVNLGSPETNVRGSELKNIAVTDAGRVFSVAEIEAGENDIIGIPPIFFGSRELVLLEHDPASGSIINVTELTEDFGVDFTEAVNALAPLPGGGFLAVGEFFIGSNDQGQDFVFTIDQSGQTTFKTPLTQTGTSADIDNGVRRIVSADTDSAGNVFAWQDFTNSYGGGNLYTIDPSSGLPTLEASISSPFEILSISFAPNGELLATGGDQLGRASLFSIDKSAGTITQLALFGGSASFPQEFEATGNIPPSLASAYTPGDDLVNGTPGDDVLIAGAGNDIIFSGLGADLISGGRGSDTFVGTLQELAGDIITDFSQSDTLLFLQTVFGPSSLSVVFGSAILNIDADLDGTVDSVVTLQGNFDPLTTTFDVVPNGSGGTEIRLVPTNASPVASDDAFSVSESGALTIDPSALLGNDSDIDGDPLSIVDLNTQGLAGSLVQNQDGSYTFSPSLAPGQLGLGESLVTSFGYTVGDGRGGVDSARVEITISGELSLDAQDDSYSVGQGSSFLLPADSLTANDIAPPSSGTLSIVDLDVSQLAGSLSLIDSSNLQYTAAPGFSGVDAFSYTVSGSNGEQDTAIVRISVGQGTNTDPVASDDGYVTDEDVPLVIAAPGVLVNDTDVDGDALSAVLVSGPSNGTLTLNPDGSFTYTPAADFNGSDSFTYNADDGNGGVSPATVDITVNAVNDDPVAVDDGYATGFNASLTIAAGAGLLTNDTDLEGDALTASLNTGPANGTVTVNPDGSFDYTPNAGFSGADTFTYDISDGNGGTDTGTVTVTVGTNTDPVASDDGYVTDEDVPLVIAAPGVLVNDTDVDGDALSAVLVSGPSNGTLTLNPDGSFTYTPAADFNGSDSFTYNADDGNGGVSPATVDITVNAVNDDPVAVDDGYATGFNASLTIAAGAGLLTNDTDLEGDALTASLNTGPANGTVTVNPDGSFDYTPNAGFSGADTFTYDISDGNGGTDTGTVTVTVGSNTDPVATDDGYVTDEDVPLVIAAPGVLVNDTDVDGDALSAVLVSGPSNGTLTLNPDGSFTYTPAADFNGSDSFTYNADDGNGGVSPATVDITVNAVNDDPVAVDDGYATGFNAALTIAAGAGLLTNDTDLEGDALTASLNTGPANGTVTVNPDGSFDYTPNAGFSGADTFTYDISDGNGGTDTGTVTVTVGTNTDPVASDDGYVTDEDVPLVIAAPGVLVNDTDVDGDALSAVLVSGPSNGTLTLNPDGSFTYTPAADFNGSDSFTYNADDGNGGVSPATVDITVNAVNDDPVAVDDGYATGFNASLTIAAGAGLLTNDTDLEGDALTASLNTGPANGTVTVNPDGSFDYTPNAGFSGADTFTYDISDGNGGTDTGTVTVTVGSNTDPVATDDGYVTDEDVPLVIAAPGVLVNDTDVDGDALSAVLVSGPSNGTLTLNPDGSFTYTPAADFNGSDSFTYNADDGNGGVSPATVDITVNAVNDDPVAVDDIATVAEDGSVLIDVVANDSDPDGDPLSITSVSGASNGTVSIVSGQISYTPNTGFSGSDTIDYVIDDGNGGTDTGTVAVTVTPGGGSGGPDYSGFTDIAAIGQVAGTAAPEKFDFGSTRGEVVDSGGPGVDAFVFDDFSARFVHRILDFEAGDILDVSALTNFTTGDTVSDYVKFGGRATKTLKVDIDGAGTAFGFQDLVRLTDASGLASAQDLYDNGLLYLGGGGTPPQNTLPIAVDDVATVAEDGSVLIDVVANDSDPDGDPLSITSVSGASNGTVSIVSGQISYTPNTGFSGSDTIDYVIDDGNGGTDTGTVAVTVTPGGGSGGPDYSGFTDIAAIGQVAGTAAPEKFDFGSTRGEVVDSGGPGVDAFVFDDFSARFVHRILDFEAGDILDVSALTNFTTGDTVSDYVKFGGRATKTLKVDIDGAGTAFGFQDLVRLTDASGLASAQGLYDDGLLYI